MTQIELKDIKGQFMKLIELAASGEEVIISKDKLRSRPFSAASHPFHWTLTSTAER
jgi:hypothetical protein